jgi:hypothetical protein
MFRPCHKHRPKLTKEQELAFLHRRRPTDSELVMGAPAHCLECAGEAGQRFAEETLAKIKAKDEAAMWRAAAVEP